jgi:hypothetical protein
MAQDADVHVRALRARSPGIPVALVTLQWGLSDAEQFAPLADLIRHAQGRCAFWIRLHPVMLEQRAGIAARFTALGAPNVFVDEPSDLPLYALLRHADVHLTHSSSTVIEAELFGVRSVVTSRYGAEIYPRQIDSGVALLVESDVAVCWRALQDQVSRRGAVVTQADRAGPALEGLLAEAGISAGARPE